MRVSSVRISTRSLRSRFVSGSSIRNARGSRTSARPSATRCIWPPDICAGCRFISSSMCSSSDDALELRVDVGLRHPARPQRRRDVLRRGLLRVERVALEHHRQVALGRRRLRGVDAVQVHGAGVGLLEPGDHAQRRGLARAGRAEQDEERALGDVELELLQRLDVAERLRDARRDDRAGHRLTTFSVVGSYAGGGAPWWRTVTTCSSSKRTVGGIRTCSRPASVSTT